MTEVNALKTRIVELERQSVKALEGLMKANDRLLASTNLQRWGDEKPDWGSDVIIYRRTHKVELATMDRHVGCLIGNGHAYVPEDDARWCYVPAAPDWSKL